MTSKLFTRRRSRTRYKISQTADRPRLSVFRSGKHIYAQVIDDLKGATVASASTNEKGEKAAKSYNIDAAASVGKQVVFDRGGYIFHGRIKALADAAREGGLEF